MLQLNKQSRNQIPSKIKLTRVRKLIKLCRLIMHLREQESDQPPIMYMHFGSTQ